jgi:ribonuclease HI
VPSHSPSGQPGDLFGSRTPHIPEHYLIAHIDGGSRGNPGPSAYGVVVEDEKGQSVAELSEYLGRQTNNFAEYQGLIAALEYAVQHGHKGLKVISDSELLVRQIQGGYRVHNPVLQDLHARARQLTKQLDWFSISHVLRGKNQAADRLANAAMDKGQGRTREPLHPTSSFVAAQELKGIVRNGKVELLDGELSDGTRVQVRVIRQEA